MTTQTLFLIRGLPGSGKSRMARQLVDNGKACVMFEADAWLTYESHKDGYGFTGARCEYHWTPSRSAQAHDRCQIAVRKSLRNGESVVVSNTFTQRCEMQPYLNMAADMGIGVEIITATGDYGSVHNIPESVIAAMRQRWEDL